MLPILMDRETRIALGHKKQAQAITKHGESNSPIYAIYHVAKQRCSNPRDARFKDYGGRGIQFRFQSYEQFRDTMGPRPAGHQLDRIDNDGHYEPGNVHWVTPKQQAANRRPHPFKGRPRKPRESAWARARRLVWGESYPLSQ